ncbi:hypothetical protein ACFL6G_03215, partial [candidate division KSB1 bacterium]
NKYDDAGDDAGRSFYGDKIESFNRRRDAALIAGGLYTGTAFISQVIWGRHNSHLYGDSKCCNVTTKSFITMGLLSFGSALYFDHVKYYKEERLPDAVDDAGRLYYNQQIIINRYRRDISLLYGVTTLSAGLINHFLLRNEMPLYPSGDRWSLQRWNPVSRSNLVYTALSAAAVSYFVFRKNNSNDNRKSAETEEEITAVSNELKVFKHKRDAMLIGAGTSFLAGLLSQLWSANHMDDAFTGNSIIPLPGFLSNRKFDTAVTMQPGMSSPGYSFVFEMKFK